MLNTCTTAIGPFSDTEAVPPGSRFMQLPPVFAMKRGGRLHHGRLAYETWGSLSKARDNAILIFTGLSPDAHVASNPGNPAPGWWEGMIGPDKAINTRDWYVICVNSLGSCKGSTGPASYRPDDAGQTYRQDFPDLSIEDIADASAHVIRSLEIDMLACVIGCSMGGMSALSFLARHPGRARTHINVSSAVHADPFALAVRSLQRDAIRQDPNWNDGHYTQDRFPLTGMVLARKLGLISYRSAQEWKGRFGRKMSEAATDGTPGDDFAILGYLESHAKRFLRDFDPNAYLYLSGCIDRFDLGDAAQGHADRALANMVLDRALVLGTGTDILFPLDQQRQIADGLRACGADTQFHALTSHQGHDSFLVDLPAFGSPIAAFLQDLVPRAPMVRRTPLAVSKERLTL